jgi:hypothetical protein
VYIDDKNILDLIIYYVIDRVLHIFDRGVELSPRGIVLAGHTPPAAEKAIL